jgi:hypothetical protein
VGSPFDADSHADSPKRSIVDQLLQEGLIGAPTRASAQRLQIGVLRVMITDKLASYGAAKREVMPGIEHRQYSTTERKTRTSRRADESVR